MFLSETPPELSISARAGFLLTGEVPLSSEVIVLDKPYRRCYDKFVRESRSTRVLLRSYLSELYGLSLMN